MPAGDPFHYADGELRAERVNLAAVAAAHGTPCYVYSRAAMEGQWRAFDRALASRPHRLCYAVKANGNLAVLDVLARLGSGFDIVSVGELERVLAAGGDPGRVVFSGPGKGAHEIRRALEVGIDCFNVESEAELERINALAGHLGRQARIAVRVNPDVDADTHPYIATGLHETKFGIDIEAALAVYDRAATLPHVAVAGIDCHIGSQLTRVEPYRDALERVVALADALGERGIGIEHMDVGGGFGITYQDETPPEPDVWGRLIDEVLGSRALTVLAEPGRAVVGNAGVLLTRVEYTKTTAHRCFAVVDAGMNDLLRPALYDAWHDIIPVALRGTGPGVRYDVVGPVCESGDFLGHARELILEAGDLLAVRSAGAYGFVMSSNYNARPRPPEVMVDGDEHHAVRARESLGQLMAGEQTLPRTVPDEGTSDH